MLSNNMSKPWYKNSLVLDSHPMNEHFTHVIRLEEKEGNSNNDKAAQ